MKPEIQLLLDILDESYQKRTWHGPNLKGSLRGISAKQAAWRPHPTRHNIWEITVHAAYWKYAVRRRITGERRGSFPLNGSNWFRRPEAMTEAAWKADRQLLDRMHRNLVETVSPLSVSQLRTRPAGSRVRNIEQLYGVALHDVYHAGQIQLLKRMMRTGNR